MNPYIRLMRLHKPVGIVLLLWPVLWALVISSHGKPNIEIIIIFVLGTIVMRSAGCIINDIADRKFDKFVKRTKKRPVTTGEVSVKEALILFFGLLCVAFILVLQLNTLTILLSFIALFLACLYPYTKRFLPYPQLFLALAYSMGIPMVFAATLHYVPVISWFLYVVNMLWVIMYDTEYAIEDKKDDIKIGLKSTAILLGKYDVAGVVVLQALTLLLLSVLGLRLSLILIAVLFGYQYYLLKKGQGLNAFLNNQWVGLIIFLGIIFTLHHALYWDDLMHFLR